MSDATAGPTTGFVYDDRYLEHDTGPGHPERPDRLRAVTAYLRRTGLWDRLLPIDPVEAGPEAIARVHTAGEIRSVQEAAERAPAYIDSDTVVSPASYRIALLAAGGAVAACDAVMAGSCANAFAALRPPGHHAERDRAMGFCLFNNVAVAARHLQTLHGLKRILILDWDVHHGNGTQDIFYDDPTVLYISLHQHPLYPGTGRASETGRGAGEGTTLNIPLPPSSGDEKYREALISTEPVIAAFNPEFVLVSAGFDAHERDPLANMKMTAEGFGYMARFLRSIADRHCGGRLVALLEGGYDPVGLATSVAATLLAMMEGRDAEK